MAYNFQESIQRGIIYLMKSDTEFFNEIVHLVKPSYFESPIHANIFRVISDHFQEYTTVPCDDIIVETVKEIKSTDELIGDYRDEIRTINELSIQSFQNKEFYLDLIEEFAKKQAIKDALLNSIQHLKRDDTGAIEEELRSALTISRNVDLGISYTDDFDTRWERNYARSAQNKIRTGFHSMDNLLEGGVGRKELAMVVAPPGTGKSLFLAHLGVVGLLQGLNVLYISLEMSEDKVAQRFDSNLTSVPQITLKDNKDEVKKRLNVLWEDLEKKYKKKPRLKIKEFPTGQLTVHGIRAFLTQIKNYDDFIPDLICVDYLELMRPTSPGMAEYQAQERIAQELRGIASEYGVLVWTATQTNRDGRKVPLISDTELADAYGKTRTCDLAMSINQTSEEFDNGKARLYVFKSRNSRTKFVTDVKIDYNLLTMREV